MVPVWSPQVVSIWTVVPSSSATVQMWSVVDTVEQEMPSNIIDRMDDFDILVGGCLDYTMERLAQKNRG